MNQCIESTQDDELRKGRTDEIHRQSEQSSRLTKAFGIGETSRRIRKGSVDGKDGEEEEKEEEN